MLPTAAIVTSSNRAIGQVAAIPNSPIEHPGTVDLFTAIEEQNLEQVQPLAARMRPGSLEEFVGQQHLLGAGCLLRRMIDSNRIGSVILHGPPGTGKTTLAGLLAQATSRRFHQLSAIEHGVKEVREILQAARTAVATGQAGTLLFIDEIHRFNKSQQDALLGDVESGVVALVGATTSNPYFAVNNALLSRSQVFQLQPLSIEQLEGLLQRVIADEPRGLGRYNFAMDQQALRLIARLSDGDARRALTALEIAVLSTCGSNASGETVQLDVETVRQSLAARQVAYDADGDLHYDCASALIKSMRGTDPDAAIYWLARMLAGGEDIRFICRRLVIFASEDIGNADPQALPMAVACFQACEQVGLPECQLNLSQTVAYLACAPKSNASTRAIFRAQADIREDSIQEVPRHLRDSHYSGAAELGHGSGYQNPHQHDEGIVDQDYLGVDVEYYAPVDRGFESELKRRLQQIRDARE